MGRHGVPILASTRRRRLPMASLFVRRSRGAVATQPGNGDRGGGAAQCRSGRRMAVSVMQRCLAVVWGVLTLALAAAGAQAQPTVTVTMRLAEAEWHVVRQVVVDRFDAICN